MASSAAPIAFCTTTETEDQPTTDSPDISVSAQLAVRLDPHERAAVARIVANLRSPRRPRVTASDAIRAVVRELDAIMAAERGDGMERPQGH